MERWRDLTSKLIFKVTISVVAMWTINAVFVRQTNMKADLALHDLIVFVRIFGLVHKSVLIFPERPISGQYYMRELNDWLLVGYI